MDPLSLLIILVVIIGVVTLIVARNKRRSAGNFRSGATQIPPGAKTNTLALVSFILSFFASIPAVVVGHVALNQLAVRQESGRGFAIAGLTIGYISIVISLVAIAVLLSTSSQFR
ncbi:uncharacterized protein DUF4190 [Rhodoglobus vestalii]|uniref:Uncharacterized protein DUF4190 n=1 Tax=Rhodoglobus vestalii TaxID=193384 RepID=A0A8H2K6K8_9MICO|nr:DUF4190 domain-containing protein [Rhodoglobus vestalii]TQO19624.1 uncharacterized protein DUF4190 [Rhodoglobus vestalii]